LLPHLVTPVLSREAAQNLCCLAEIHSSQLSGRCAVVVTACALAFCGISFEIEYTATFPRAFLRITLSRRAVPADDCCRGGLCPLAIAAAFVRGGFESRSDSKPLLSHSDMIFPTFRSLRRRGDGLRPCFQ